MLPFGSDELRPAVVGEGDVADALSGRRVGGRRLEATAFEPGAVASGAIEHEDVDSGAVGCEGDGLAAVDGLERADCLVVDFDAVGSDGVDLVGDGTGPCPERPVVALVDGAGDRSRDASLAAEALDAGAAGVLPRGVLETDPGVVASQLVATVERERARSVVDDLFDGVGAAVALCDPSTGEVLAANERFCSRLGYDREQVHGSRLGEWTADVAGYDSERAMEALEATGDGEVELEWPFGTAEGGVRWTESSLERSAVPGREVVVWSARDVTERRQLERSYREVFEGVSDGLVVHDPETGEIRDVNERYCSLTGYDRETLVGGNLRRIVSDDAGDTFEDALERIERAREEGPQLFEFETERADGDTFVGEVHLSVVELRGEEQVLASVRDVTERKRREREYEQIFDGVNDALAVRDPETGRLVEANDSYADLLGYDPGEMVGMSIGDVGADGTDGDGRGREIIDRVMADGGPVEFEWQVETADGDRRLMDVTATAATINGRKRYLAIGRDVTERRQYERELRRERDRRSVLFENTPDPIMAVTFEDDWPHITEVNAAFEETFGFDADSVGDRPLDEVLVPEGEREEFDRLRQRVLRGDPVEAEAPRKTADGEREFLIRVLPFDGDGARQAYVWYTDVTERKRRARMVRTLHGSTERLQEAETTGAVCRAAVEAARDVLGLPMTACWRHRETPDGPALEPVAATEPVREVDPATFRPGDTEYATYREGETLVYDPSESFPENPLDAAVLLPLGEHGLLAAGETGVEEYDEFVVDAARTLAGHVRTALNRVVRAQQLRENERRLQAILDRIDEAIFLAPAAELNETDPAPEYVSSGYEDIYGRSLEAMHETHEEGFFGTLHDGDYDDYCAFVDRVCRDVEAGEVADSYTHEYRIRRPDGEVRWVTSDYYPTGWDDGSYKIVIVSRDITERKRRERTLESFHDATAELTTADTVDEAGGIAVRAAAEVFGLPSTAVYHYDDGAGRLEPVARGPAVEADLAPLAAADGTAWTAFVEDEMCRCDAGREPGLDVGTAEEALLVPLGGNGIFVVWDSAEAFDPDTATIVAATVEAAFNRLRGERELESRSQELEAQAERARRLEAVTELIQRVEAAITAESSRRGIQRAVCDELTDVDPFDAAWVAGAEVGTDRLTPRAVAGVDRDRVEAVLGETDGSTGDTHPAREAWQRGEPVAVNDLVGGPRSGWRRALLGGGTGAVCAVPLAYSGVTHGVLVIHADEPDAFGADEVDVLDQLGTSIGHAIVAIERRRALESDNTLELEFRGEGTDLPFARLARTAGCRVRHERTVRRQDGSVSVYYSLLGDLPDDVGTTAAGALPGSVDVVTRESDEAVIERRGSSWPGSVVSEYGGVFRRGRADPSGATLLVELPRETDTRTIVDRIREAFPELELTAQRQHRERSATPGETRHRIETRLTDRQYEALETAHTMGYFDWPRESSGEDVAGALGITQPTVNKHIRVGERKVFDLLFGEDAGDTD